MENSLLTTLTALMLLGVQRISAQTPVNNTTAPSTTPLTIAATSTNIQVTCPKNNQVVTKPFLVRLKVNLKKGSSCEGQMNLQYPNRSTDPLCFNSYLSHKWWEEVCKEMRCGPFDSFKPISMGHKGLLISSNMTLNYDACTGMMITCQDPLGTELAAYKAVTGILIFLILGVILAQFGRPTYKAIRKRFSQKRQNRWVGPTQSVCYHRGQGPPNKNTDKRQSFLGLERLTVNQSREPSSNRNSDYDSYS
ncbi:T-cell surface glycoprotein CD5 [Puntigrus tetrazona]|uniref:T-cell surface glycoprotein CD5 n=1 Tax=Puntigrus tetrazona TaxID=1606681 RepID=UPI001C8A95C6|nr:T-cell surface glycoprotein CD5 [Puntigrus tetrazona]